MPVVAICSYSATPKLRSSGTDGADDADALKDEEQAEVEARNRAEPRHGESAAPGRGRRVEKEFVSAVREVTGREGCPSA